MKSFLFACICCIGLLQAEVKTVVFDFGGVVVNSYRTEMAQLCMSALHLNREEVRSAFSAMLDEQEKGGSDEVYWQNFAQARGIQLPPDWFSQYQKAEKEALQLIPGTVAIIEALQKQGYRTALLSNMSHYQANVVNGLGYFRWFNPLLLSYQTGYSKPNPKAYENLLKILQEKPDELVFIDDKEENVKAARKWGIIGILFKNPEQLEADLNKLGIHLDWDRSKLL